MSDKPNADLNLRPRPPLASIALLAAGALAYEVLLTRLFAIIQWHHFAYMIISLALLGYGASGSFLALLGRRAERRFSGLFIANAALFGLTSVAGFLLAQRIPFNALEIAWDRYQLAYLLAMYALLAVPFFCAANCFGLAFLVYRAQIARIYAVDLIAAGAGALAVIGLLFVVKPLGVLWVLGLTGLAAAALSARRAPWLWLVLALAAAAPAAFLPERWTTLQISPYKSLSQALQIIGAERIAERSSPLGIIDVVANDRVPFRYAPGLSLAASQGPGEQLGLFSDGESLGAITRFDGATDLSYLDFLTSALPYHLLQQPEVLILGAGGGASVLQALYHNAAAVTAVELNPQIVALLRGPFAAFAGHLYERPEVRVQIGEARGFVALSRQRYDLIQLELLDAFSASSAGLYALSESVLYTVEALQDYLRRLKPGGLLAITRWLHVPPRDSLKLFATAIAALQADQVADPGRQLALIRGWKTSTLLVKNGAISDSDIAALKDFSQRRSFDTAYYPGMPAAEANRFNLLERAYLYEGARALLGPQRQTFLERYKFDLQPATDDRPYFFHFFKWQVLPELLTLRAGAGYGQLEWGYLVLVATLGQALLAASLLILLPLWLGRRSRPAAVIGAGRWRVLLYFTAIGLGFLFLEIAFIQKFIVFLSHPLYAVAVVLAAFLVFAGLGSHCAGRSTLCPGLPGAVVGIAAIATLYLVVLPSLFQWALAWPEPGKILLAVGLIAPLAFCMGMPFPLGLLRIAAEQLPWAWAINGCASVVSAVLATLLAIELGFSGVILAAVGLYLVAGLSLRAFAGEPPV